MRIYENRNLENIDGEIWKEIEDYDGDYQISNFGRVKSFKKCRGIDVRILKQHKDAGYLCVKLCKSGEGKPKRIYTLMYENHIGKIPEGYVIHHIDFTKNNFLENLQVMTKEEHNTVHHTGMKHKEESKELMRGENHPRSILKEQDVIEIWKLLDEGILTQVEIGKLFGVSRHTISNITRRKSWVYLNLNGGLSN